ncbi:MAG: hypothetical protein HC897_12850 [Thermoanaerobaculia bacterium]|nr:hypothetical protein [Thermoanaerobaculia bacterium]
MTLISPQGGVLTSTGVPRVELEYEDASGVDTASLFIAIDDDEITEGCQVGPEGASCLPSALGAGVHGLRIELRDLEGNLATLAESFTLELQLPVQITEPATGSLTTALTTTVSGTVSPAADSVRVAGVPAVLQAGTFVAEAVPLREGANVLSAVASSSARRGRDRHRDRGARHPAPAGGDLLAARRRDHHPTADRGHRRGQRSGFEQLGADPAARAGGWSRGAGRAARLRDRRLFAPTG